MSDTSPTSDFDLEDRPATDLDIACLRLFIQNSTGGPSTSWSPRPWLRPEQNAEMKTKAAAIWAQVDADLQAVAEKPLGDRPVQSELNKVVLRSLKKAQESHGIQDSMIRRTLNERMEVGNANWCLERDLDRTRVQLTRGMRTLTNKSLLSKSFIVDSLTHKLNHISDSAFSSPVDGQPSFDQGSKKTDGSGLLSDWIDRIRSRFTKGASTEVGDHVDQKRQELAQRFGLDGVSIAGSSLFTERQQLRWIQTMESALEKACKRLGIQENQFGAGGMSALQIEPPEVSRARSHEGAFGLYGVNNTQFCIGVGTSNVVGTIVHEYTHQLDHLLARKAVMTRPSLFPENCALHKLDLFTGLNPAQKALVPEAEEALSRICGQLGQSGLIDKIKMAAVSVGLAHPGLDREELKKHGPAQVIAFEKINDIVKGALRLLPLEHLGDEKMLSLSQADLQAYQKSMEKDGADLLLHLGVHVGEKSMRELVGDFREERASKGLDPFIEFVDIGERVHGGSSEKALSEALVRMTPHIIEIGARLHPMSQMAHKNGSVEPSEMLISSLKQDAEGAEWGGNRYHASPPEILARLMDRPQSFDAMLEMSDTDNQLMSFGQLKSLNAGMARLLDAAGITRTGQPQLNMTGESLLRPVERCVSTTADKIEALAQRVNGLMGSLSGQTKKPLAMANP
jgi:hypothetical protein